MARESESVKERERERERKREKEREPELAWIGKYRERDLGDSVLRPNCAFHYPRPSLTPVLLVVLFKAGADKCVSQRSVFFFKWWWGFIHQPAIHDST
jgi:hypothetical protein